MKKHAVDRLLLGLLVILVTFGFIIFSSASMGLLTRDGAQFGAVMLKQLVFGILFGGVALLIASSVHYRLYRKYAFWLYLASFILTIAVFIPDLGFEHGGARRWLSLGPILFQPGEFLKIGFVIYFAAWLSAIKNEKQVGQYGFLPFIGLSALTGAVFLFQPDTDGFLIVVLAGAAMFYVAGGTLKHFFLLFLIGLIGSVGLFYTKPYIRERIMTFVDFKQVDVRGAGYQINQSLIAIGSGGLLGRGFGQSVQKFQYLPEPIGDSIFAVASEEFGFVGGGFLILLFLGFSLRGIRVSIRAPDIFATTLGVGIVILIFTQSLLNMASMLALFPLSGTPLVFVSQGGTALLVALAETGILLNISRYYRG